MEGYLTVTLKKGLSIGLTMKLAAPSSLASRRRAEANGAESLCRPDPLHLLRFLGRLEAEMIHQIGTGSQQQKTRGPSPDASW